MAAAETARVGRVLQIAAVLNTDVLKDIMPKGGLSAVIA